MSILHDNFKRDLTELLSRYYADIEAWNDDGYARIAVVFNPISGEGSESSDLELGGWFPNGEAYEY